MSRAREVRNPPSVVDVIPEGSDGSLDLQTVDTKRESKVRKRDAILSGRSRERHSIS